ncbi:MAG: hypothetical protein PHI97_32720 [Desulfobulbus sp.]|nr:hypothetical protein [Desulfobulbus sp.]
MGCSSWRSQVLALVVVLASLYPARLSQAEEQAVVGTQPDQCQALVTQIEAQNHQLHQELRQIKRELAMLNQNLEKPGVREIMAGIGYILGLFGVAAMVSARRQDRKEN